MLPLPRIALGTVQTGAELEPVAWGLLDLLCRNQWQTQSYLSVANLARTPVARCITGQSQRHLDSWLMSRATCREIFERGARASDISLVEGHFAGAMRPGQKASLDSLCDWLDLPPIAVIDIQQWSTCVAPRIPEGLAGFILDRVPDAATACRWQTNLEALLRAPMLGYLDEAHALRARVVDRTCERPCQELSQALGERLQRHLSLERLLKISQTRPLAPSPQRLFVPNEGDDKINVAVAFDEAFNGYFADTLDLLEIRGAKICDFSPLRSDALPWETDIVYLGGGAIEHYADALARNHCMKQALRNFVAQGGRIYAEGGGLAYLCERLVTGDARQHCMVGLVPAATALQTPGDAQPVEVTFGQHTWLGERGTAMRGYADATWDLLPCPTLTSFASEPARHRDLVGTQRVIGCRMQVDFAGQPHLLSSFFRPRRGALVGVDS